jgi:hypothetical protein
MLIFLFLKSQVEPGDGAALERSVAEDTDVVVGVPATAVGVLPVFLGPGCRHRKA